MVVDFQTRREMTLLGNKTVIVPKNRVEFLFTCKEVLSIEDYEEVLCSVLDQDYYDNADPQIKKIVDNYYDGFSS